MKTSNILGLNARSKLFTYKYNKKEGKKIADSKILTERVLKKYNIPTPEILVKFRNEENIIKFDWDSLPSAFAVKPSKGLGGEGIVVVKKRAKDKSGWITTQRKKVTKEDLMLHAQDILEGAYSIGNIPDVAFVQEYIGRHKRFRKYAFRGTPDIRIIVFNNVPIMAMLRLPTKESSGRANLHQGAIGVGIDIATGITTKALLSNRYITYKPGTKRKIRGLKIPNWTSVLEMAVNAAYASGLGYCGVDIVLHPDKGPMVIELNARPGLQIQLANNAGLKKRLERVEDLNVKDSVHGVRIAKALFSERFADRVKAEEGIKTIKAVEEITIKTKDDKRMKVMAKIDTGAWASSIDINLARDLGLYNNNNVLWYKNTLNAMGKEERPVIDLTFWLSGRRIKTTVSVTDRKDLTYKFLVGRSDLTGFLVNPEIADIHTL